MNNYQDWISNYCAQEKWITGRCREAVNKMVEAFPELKPVAGYVTHFTGRSEHWWCIDSAGNVVDPSASQFQGIFEYLPWEDGNEIRVGRCMDCGDDIYVSPASLKDEDIEAAIKKRGGKSFCNKICEESFTHYMDGEINGN